MKILLKPAIFFITSFLLATASFAQKTVLVGGSAMYPSKTIVENAEKSNDHTRLMEAVKAAGLAETLQSAGPFTVFAPTNAAFNKLPAGTVETLLKPENKATLSAILTYHVISGNINSTTLMQLIKKNGGKHSAQTVQGEKITFTLDNKNIILHDTKGGVSKVTIKDVNQRNGVIHVIDTVVMP